MYFTLESRVSIYLGPLDIWHRNKHLFDIRRTLLRKYTKKARPPRGTTRAQSWISPGRDGFGEREVRREQETPHIHIDLFHCELARKRLRWQIWKHISIFHTHPSSANLISVQAGPAEKLINHPEVAPREQLRIQTWYLEARTPTQDCTYVPNKSIPGIYYWEYIWRLDLDGKQTKKKKKKVTTSNKKVVFQLPIPTNQCKHWWRFIAEEPTRRPIRSS